MFLDRQLRPRPVMIWKFHKPPELVGQQKRAINTIAACSGCLAEVDIIVPGIVARVHHHMACIRGYLESTRPGLLLYHLQGLSTSKARTPHFYIRVDAIFPLSLHLRMRAGVSGSM
jgi:hypothetical protein